MGMSFIECAFYYAFFKVWGIDMETGEITLACTIVIMIFFLRILYELYKNIE